MGRGARHGRGARDGVALRARARAAGGRSTSRRSIPATARRMFVEEALVRRQSSMQARRSSTATTETRRGIERLEAKLRRRDLLAQDDVLAAFYLERIPADVASARSFEHWWRAEERRQPHRLDMPREAHACRSRCRRSRHGSYPDTWSLDGNELPLDYVFDATSPDDGVTLTVPLPLLGALSSGAARLAGARHAAGQGGRAAARAAEGTAPRPRADPRRGGPVPRVAAGRAGGQPARAAREIRDGEVRPGDRGRGLRGRRAARRIAAQLPRAGRRRATNSAGVATSSRCVASSRPAGVATASRRSRSRLEPRGRAPLGLRRHPGGCHRQDRRRLGADVPGHRGHGRRRATAGCIRSPQQARLATRDGVVRLAALAMPQQHDLVRRSGAADRELALLAAAAGLGRASLRRDRGSRGGGGDRTRLPAPGHADRRSSTRPWTRRARQSRTRARRSQRHARNTLAALKDARTALDALAAPAFAAARESIAHQLATLVAPGWLRRTPQPWLRQLPKYLRAAARRAERLRNAVDRDRKLHEQLIPYEAALRELETAHAGDAVPAPERERLRWMLEEFRVSLFAQELRTLQPVSARRLDRAAAPGPGGIARPGVGRAGAWPALNGSARHVEVDALRERQLAAPVDRAGLAAHVGLPGVRARLAPAAGVLLAAERAADLGAGGADVDVGDAAVATRRPRGSARRAAGGR